MELVESYTISEQKKHSQYEDFNQNSCSVAAIKFSGGMVARVQGSEFSS